MIHLHHMKFFSREPVKPGEVKSNQEEGKSVAQPQGVSRRNFLVGAAALATMQAVPALAQDEQKIATILVGAPKTYQEINAAVIGYIKNLGTLTQFSVVRELKAKADALISILTSKNNISSPDVASIITAAENKETKVILTAYIDGVKMLPDNLKAPAVTEMTNMIKMIKVTAIGDIEKNLSKNTVS
jgi:hypothetical protein